MPETFARSSTKPHGHGRLEPLDRINGGLTDWPGGAASTRTVSAFISTSPIDTAPQTLAALADASARRVPYPRHRRSSASTDESLGALWRDYRDRARRSQVDPAGRQHDAVDAPWLFGVAAHASTGIRARDARRTWSIRR